jgi:predicted SpoU family rRNA methylase
MEPDERARLIAAVGEVIDSFGGNFEMHYDCHVAMAKRRS